MGAAWRNPKDRDMPAIVEIVQGVSAMGMETCMTLGMLTPDQAAQLKAAGLDYYNHNIDTAPENYANVITTRTFEERIDTLSNVQIGRASRGKGRVSTCRSRGRRVK